MGAATRSARDFCTVCGWPVHGQRCDACGEYPAPLALEDSMRRFVPKGHPSLDSHGLEKAIEAFRRGDHPRAIAGCLGAETGLGMRAVQLPEGPGWALFGKESSVFVSLDTQALHIVVESPIARLPRQQRVPAMRFALELCDREELSSRVCLRDDLLVMRFASQVGAVSPPLLRHLVREMMTLSERLTETFVAAFDARLAALGDARAGGWESLGRKRTLSTLSPAPTRRSVVPPPPSTLRPADAPAAPPEDDLPPILAPAFAGDARGSLLDALPAVLAPPGLSELNRSDGLDALPAVLAPPDLMPNTARLGAVPALFPPPSLEREMRDLPPETARLGAIPSLTTPMPFPSPAAARRRTIPGMAASSGDTTPRPLAPDLDPPDAASRRAPAKVADTPTDKLCDLLHQAQTLATALSFQERPATMLLLVRAAVFRAIHEFGEAAPDAVAYLYRSTAAVTRSIWPSSSGKRPTGSGSSLPMAEPALLAMERVVASRAQVPKEPRPLAIDPLSTAAQAREHLAKYVEEIEAAPTDVVLRHFLALGAISELLTRTRLPAQTSQRLKDIVSHALRDGARQPSIDLMMTALKRIVAG